MKIVGSSEISSYLGIPPGDLAMYARDPDCPIRIHMSELVADKASLDRWWKSIKSETKVSHRPGSPVRKRVH